MRKQSKEEGLEQYLAAAQDEINSTFGHTNFRVLGLSQGTFLENLTAYEKQMSGRDLPMGDPNREVINTIILKDETEIAYSYLSKAV